MPQAKNTAGLARGAGLLTRPLPLDQRLVRFSNRRLVLCGDFYELYRYERPYAFNVGPEPRSGFGSGFKFEGRRTDNVRVARQTLRRIVTTNASLSGELPKFVTFTFAKNVSSLPEANRLWRLFCKRLRYALGAFRYVAVVEFQKRGAVHYHVLYFDMPFVANLKPKLAALWGHGHVKAVAVSHVRNLGAYVSKYLQKDLVDSRLAGNKAFFCSKGLPRPVVVRGETDIDVAVMGRTMVPKLSRRYESSFLGSIDYSQGYFIA